MKILMLASGSVNSSLTYRLYSFGQTLSQNGHKVYMLAPAHDKYSIQNQAAVKKEKINIIHPFQFNTSSRWLNLLPYIFHSFYILIKLDFDIIHLYKPTPISVIGVIMKYIKKKPLITDIDDLGSKVMQLENNPKITIAIVRYCEYLSTKFADGIICASSYLTDKYKKEFKNKRIIWISNGINNDYIQKISKIKKDPNIIVIGSLNRNNIIEPLIEALPKISNYVRRRKLTTKIHIFGNGSSEKYLNDLATKLKVRQYINFYGYLPNDQIKTSVNAGDIGYAYMPNEVTIKAASNLKLFQYMALGIPPVVSDVGDLPIYINRGKAGYIVKKNNINDLATTCIQAIENNGEREKKSNACRNYVKENYTWELLTKKLVNFYLKFN